MWKLFIYVNINCSNEILPKENYEYNMEIVKILHKNQKLICCCKYLDNNVENITDDIFNSLYGVLYKKKNPCWHIFNNKLNLNEEEDYYLNMLLDILKEGNYEDICKTLCSLQNYNKIYEFFVNSIYESGILKTFKPKNNNSFFRKFIGKNKNPLIENENILFITRIMDILYKHIIINSQENEKKLFYTYKQLKIEILYFYNEYEFKKKETDALIFDFQQMKLDDKNLETHKKYYENLIKFSHKLKRALPLKETISYL